MSEIQQKKPSFKIIQPLREYLIEAGREMPIPVTYEDLLHNREKFTLIDNKGNDTLWETYLYDEYTMEELNKGLTKIYALLKTQGDLTVMEHLKVSRIDYCTFGNSKPFRVQIMNQLNDNYDYYYVKHADASRIYGLELEHLLSPNKMNYIVDQETLIEEHIPGIPGDQFIKTYMDRPEFNKVRLAKEFVKFNERCFIRLLGDMRSYNYVLDITPDFEDEQYRIRCIDFDQQCYEGRKSLYLPQFFKENLPIVQWCMELLDPVTMKQYQYEERTLVKKRLIASRYLLKELVDCMKVDMISTPEKVEQLAEELGRHHNSKLFKNCRNMGHVLYYNMKVLLT